MNLFRMENSLLSDEAKMLRDSIRKFKAETIINKLSVTAFINEAFNEERFPKELLLGLIDRGCLAADTVIGEEYGCNKVDYLTYGIMARELEAIDSGLRSYIPSVIKSLVRYPIFAFGTEEQKQKYLPGLADGSLVGCFALTGSPGGSDPQCMAMRAYDNGDKFILNGRKNWITNAVDGADVIVAWAQTGNDAKSIRGFLVEKGTPGMTFEKYSHKGGLRASNTGGIVFENCEIPKSALLPGTIIGIKAAYQCLFGARYSIGWGVTGAAMECFKEAFCFANERNLPDEEVGHAISLIKKQKIKFDFVEMYERISNMQLRALYVANELNNVTSGIDLKFLSDTSDLKLNVEDAIFVADRALHILASNGLQVEGESQTWRHFANLQVVKIYEGTSEIHHEIISKDFMNQAGGGMP